MLHNIPVFSKQTILQTIDIDHFIHHAVCPAGAFEKHCDFIVIIGKDLYDLHLRIQTKEELRKFKGQSGITFCGGEPLLQAKACLEMGLEPPFWRSANVPGGDEFNAKNLKKYSPRVKML